ncbi:MAG: helix-turn-helix domain-containing protein [Candidatus Merdivicinus sp.]|jgi:AraC family L-rhamnose operon transcriptional activator RhaR
MRQYDISGQSDDTFPFLAESGEMNGSFPEHTHSYTELIIILDGSGYHISANGRYSLQRGTVITVPPPIAHQMEEMDHLKIYVLKFDLNGLLSFDYELKNDPGFRSLFIQFPITVSNRESARPLLLSELQLQHVISLSQVMLQECSARKPGYKPIIRTHLLALTAYLARCFLPDRNPISHRMERIIQTVTYMEENLQHPIRVPELADQVYLSTRQYDRIFREVYGMSPSAYLAEMRLNRACQLMTDRSISLGDISEQCGFSDIAFFYRCFRKRFDMTPKQYRSHLLTSICD